MQPTLFMNLVVGYFRMKRKLKRAISFLFWGDEYVRAVERERLEALSRKQIEDAVTLKEAKEAHSSARSDTACKTSYEKWLRLSEQAIEGANSIEEIREVYFDACDNKPAYDKWEKLSLLAIEAATTVAEVEAAFNAASGVKACKEALAKIRILRGEPPGTPVVIFEPKGNWHGDNCINKSAEYDCQNESTQQAAIYSYDLCLVSSVRCCTEQACMDRARELALVQLKNDRRY